MDPSNLSRLKEEQEKVLASTDEKIEQWQKFKSDYKALKDRLKTLPDKVTHDVMVPFGSLAFMPGKLVHTNEITVLLGDNWFVERSAKQAAAIVDRRLKSVNTELEALQKQRSLFEPRISFTSELQQDADQAKDVFEIKEEFDPVKEEKWKEQHKANVLKYRKQVKEELSKGKKTEESTRSQTDEELWSRLDELERIESERKEIERMPDEVVLGRNGSSESGSSGAESDDEGGDDDDDEEEEIAFWGSEEETHTNKISFTHTKMEKQVNFSQQSSENSEDSEPKVDVEEEPLIQSPADIYSKFTLKPKSILKESTSNRHKKSKVNGSQRSQQKKVTESTASSLNTPFTGTIVEKTVENPPASVQSPTEASTSDTPSHNEPPKRVSKFKVQSSKTKTNK